MRIRNHIPEELFEGHVNLDNFVTVLDELNAYKEYEVDRSSLFYRSLLIGDTSWLKKRLEDYGYPEIPSDLPKECMDALLINARNVMALKGSDMGLKFFLWCLTFGEIDIDWSEFYPPVENLMLDEFTGKAHLLSEGPDESAFVNYLAANVSDVGGQVLTVGIKSKYWNNQAVLGYINNNIRQFLNFTEDSFVFNLDMQYGPYHAIEEPYWYFVNPEEYSSINNSSGGIGAMDIEGTFIVS